MLEPDGIDEPACATTMLPPATVTMPRNAFYLASIDADVLQDVIVERLQSGDGRPYPPRATQPRPEPDNSGRVRCTPT
jgi:hypothetical protein